MINENLKEAANNLERVINEEYIKQDDPKAFQNQIRGICVVLLETAGADGNGGCPLCCS